MKPDSRCIACDGRRHARPRGPDRVPRRLCRRLRPRRRTRRKSRPRCRGRPAASDARSACPRTARISIIADEDYIRFPLPPGEQAYAGVDAKSIKATIGEITAISRKSRDDGNQYWGRIPGTPYDRMMQDWVMSKFKALGMQDVRRQEIAMKPLWFPTAWAAEFTAGGKHRGAQERVPDHGIAATKGRVSAPVVWVGLGTAADFRGRDVAGKAVMIYSIATPGGRDHSADWSGAVKRADEAGAAIIMVEMGFPGDSQSEPEGAVGARAPTITITPDDANLIRDRLDANVEVELHLKLDTEEREGLKTANVWGVLPGASDEQILIMAHTDAFFEGAMDNASGIAMMLDIARHYGAVAAGAAAAHARVPDDVGSSPRLGRHPLGARQLRLEQGGADRQFRASVADAALQSRCRPDDRQRGERAALVCRRQRCAAAAGAQFVAGVRRRHLSQVGSVARRRAVADPPEGAELPHHRPRHLSHDPRHRASWFRPGASRTPPARSSRSSTAPTR